MKIVDRYILSRYLISFFFITASLIFVMTIFNWIDTSDKFSRKGTPFTLIITYYYYNIPYFLNIIIAVCALIASLVTFSGLEKHNELLTLWANGISRLRAIAPTLIASLCISISLFFFNEFVGVEASKKKEYIYKHEIFKKPPTRVKKFNMIWRLKNNAILEVKEYDPRTTHMRQGNIQFFNDALNVKKRIDVDSIVWNDSTWLLYGATTHVFNEDSSFSFLGRKNEPITLTEMNFAPDDLTERQFKAGRIERFQTLKELQHYSAKMKSFGQPTFLIDYEIYNAIFFPLSIFFMTFIGSLLGSSRNRGGTMRYFFICILICLLYILIVVLGKLFSKSNEIPALLGALLPHIITSFGLFFLANKR